MERVLVTGGDGFLGRHVVERLLGRVGQVRILSRGEATPDEREPARYGDGAVERMRADVRDPDRVDEAVRGVDGLVHLVSNFRSPGSDDAARSINVEGTQNVLRAAVAHDVRRVVHCSTIGVHGDVLEIPATEDTPFNPGDEYQRTKAEAERWARSFAAAEGLPLVVLRPTSLLGPGDRRMLKLFRMIDRGWFVRAGSGEVNFQFGYVKDVARAFEMALASEEAEGEVFIVGGDEYLSLNRLAQMIAEELGVELRVLPIPLRPLLAAAGLCETVCRPLGIDPPLHRRRVRFYTNERAFSLEKARRQLGYEPEVTLREGLRRTIDWYRARGWL